MLEWANVDEMVRLRKKNLEIFIERLADQKTPISRLEQYPVSTRVAAEMIWIASFYNDIFKCNIVDLGCGTGKLALACALLGAAHVTGIDVDPAVIKLAQENSRLFNLQNKASWVCGDIEVIRTTSRFDMVVMNPPFGIRGPERDIRFLDHAMKLSPVIYSLHLGRQKNRAFISETVAKRGFTIDFVSRMVMDIPHLFSFHKKRRHSIAVDLYRIIKTHHTE